jgi:hypothetical protein
VAPTRTGVITIRAVQLAYPADGVHDAGDPVQLTMALVNGGQVDDELIGVTGATVSASPAPGSLGIAAATGIPVPAGETVFVGGTAHAVELTGLTEPKTAARSMLVTLTFARAGETTALAVTATAPEVRLRGPVFDFHHSDYGDLEEAS